MKLSDDQEQVMREIEDWFHRSDSQSLTFGGLAGTGKTTIAARVQRRLKLSNVAYCAPTAKAAHVLAQKLAAANAKGTVSTIHGLIYRPDHVHCVACPAAANDWQEPERDQRCHVPGGQGKCGCGVVWQNSGPDELPELIICDEASM